MKKRVSSFIIILSLCLVSMIVASLFVTPVWAAYQDNPGTEYEEITSDELVPDKSTADDATPSKENHSKGPAVKAVSEPFIYTKDVSLTKEVGYISDNVSIPLTIDEETFQYLSSVYLECRITSEGDKILYSYGDTLSYETVQNSTLNATLTDGFGIGEYNQVLVISRQENILGRIYIKLSVSEAEPEPTPEPTIEPTAEPTTEPTSEPTAKPTTRPTATPTGPSNGYEDTTLNLIYGYSETQKIIRWTGADEDKEKLDDCRLSLSRTGLITCDLDYSDGSITVVPTKGLDCGTYDIKVSVINNEGNVLFTVKVTLRIKKKTLTVSFIPKDAIYYRGQYIDQSRYILMVDGFVEGEGRADSKDGLTVKASGYKDPRLQIPDVATETMWLVASGGEADNYTFDYIGSHIYVSQRDIDPGEICYTIEGGGSTKGWSKENIRFIGKTVLGDAAGRKYKFSLKNDGSNPMDTLTISDETDNGKLTFYIVDPITHEIFGPVVYTYKLDKTAPVIENVTDGGIYKVTTKQITISDKYLKSIIVNGREIIPTSGRYVLTVARSSQLDEYDITAIDEAGLSTHCKFSLEADEEPGGNGLGTDAVTPTPPDTDEDTTVNYYLSPSIFIDKGAPTISVNSSNKSLINALFNNEEKNAIFSGHQAEYKLIVKDENATVSQEVKENIIKNAEDYSAVYYFSLVLSKRIDDGEWTDIPETKKPVNISVDIPSDVLRTSNDNHTVAFALAKASSSSFNMLESENDQSSKITVSTKDFQPIYSILYKDVPLSSGPKTDSNRTSNNDNNDKESQTLDKTPEAGDDAMLTLALCLAIISLVGIAILTWIKKVNAA